MYLRIVYFIKYNMYHQISGNMKDVDLGNDVYIV